MLEDIYRRYSKVENDYLYRKGYAQGRLEVKKENALKVKTAGIAIDLISNITGLSVEEIEKL